MQRKSLPFDLVQALATGLNPVGAMRQGASMAQAFTSPQPSAGDQDQRLVDALKAIEFGEYLAKSAENFLRAFNALEAVRESEDEEKINCAKETVSELFSGLQSEMYEFRKRAARALSREPVMPASLDPQTEESSTEGNRP